MMFSWTVNWECPGCNAKGNVVVPSESTEDTTAKPWLRRAYDLVVTAHYVRTLNKCKSEKFSLSKDFPTITITKEDLKP